MKERGEKKWYPGRSEEDVGDEEGKVRRHKITKRRKNNFEPQILKKPMKTKILFDWKFTEIWK